MSAEQPDQPSQKRGWQLPGAVSGGVATPSTGAHDPLPTLKNSVLGQVADEDQATVQTDTGPLPLVNYRLERNDPQEGRSFVASIRLSGTDAVGFANRGDWIEAVGARKAAFFEVSYCVNRTTGAVFKAKWRRTTGCLKALVILGVVSLFCFFAFTALHATVITAPASPGIVP